MINRDSLINHPYRTINAAIAGSIFVIFLYSAVFSPEKSRHPIPSSHTLITGEYTASNGLSRGFSAIMRLQFDQARGYNIYSLRIFSFFFIQFFVRLVFLSANYIILDIGESRFAMLDAILSGVLFLFLFEPFLLELIKSSL